MGASYLPQYQVDRAYFSVGTLDDNSDEKQYWLTRTPTERLLAVEMTRQVIYGYASTAPRFQRVFEFAELKAS
jgi:hypothetical protein